MMVSLSQLLSPSSFAFNHKTRGQQGILETLWPQSISYLVHMLNCCVLWWIWVFHSLWSLWYSKAMGSISFGASSQLLLLMSVVRVIASGSDIYMPHPYLKNPQICILSTVLLDLLVLGGRDFWTFPWLAQILGNQEPMLTWDLSWPKHR